MKMSAQSIDQNRVESFRFQATGLSEGEYSFHPSVPLVASRPLGTFTPEDAKSQDSLGMVVRWRNPLKSEKKPKGIDLTQESSGKPARLVLSVAVKGNQSNKSGIKSAPLSNGRRGMSHMAKAPQLGMGPLAESRYVKGLLLGELLSLSDQVSQTGLSEANPFAVNAVRVAHQDAFPISYESLKGLLRPVCVDHEECNGGIGHHPEPLQHPIFRKRGLINMVDLAFAGKFANPTIVRFNGRRCTIDDFLYGAETDGNVEHRSAEFLNKGATVPLASGHLSNGGTQSRPISDPVSLGNPAFVHLAATWTFTPVEHKMGDLHLDFRKLDVLMGVERVTNHRVYSFSSGGSD